MTAKPLIQGLLQEAVRPALFGSIQSATASITFFISGPLGRATDLYGRSIPLFVTLCILSIGFASLAISGPSIAALCFGLLSTQAFRQIEEILKAYVSDATEPEHRLVWLQVFYACAAVGFGAGPMFGKWCNASLGFKCTLALTASLALAASAWLWRDGLQMHPCNGKSKSHSPGMPVRQAVRQVANDANLRLLFLMRLCQSCAAHVMFSTLGLFMTKALGEPKEKYADLLSLNAMTFTCVQVLQPFVARIIGLSCTASLFGGMVIIAVSRAIFVFCATSFLRCFACYALAIVGIGMYIPAVVASTTAMVDPNIVGLTLGLSATVETVAETLMPIVGGIVFEMVGPYGPCTVAMTCSVLGVIPAMAFQRRQACAAAQRKQE